MDALVAPDLYMSRVLFVELGVDVSNCPVRPLLRQRFFSPPARPDQVMTYGFITPTIPSSQCEAEPQ